MVTFICYNICKYFKGCFKPSKSPEIPDPNMAYSSPSRSPDRTPPNLQPISNPISQPAQNLEIFMEKDFYKLTTDEKYFSLEELTYYKDKYPSPTRKPLKKIRWKPGDFLGQGSYGTVVMGFNAVTGEIMAVKQVNVQGDEKSENNEKVASLESEIALLMQFEHPNIVRYLGTNRTRNKFNIFLEYISGGSIAFLLKKYGKFNENIVRQYTFQILKGLEYLHWHKVLHRDIKGGNVLVDNKGVCKLADFGSSKRLSELFILENMSLMGTANWMAPEVIKQSVISRFSDIWSLGCTVIEMATGRPPWSECNNALTTMFYIANSNEPPKIPENFSPELRDFLQKCLKIIPCERANCLQLINHVFISGNQATYKEIVSPILRRNLVEKEQDFFEIKLSERPNRFNETFSKRNSGEHENDIKDSGLIFKIFKRKKSATKDHYNISGIISKDHINAFENNNLRNNNENLGSKGVEKEKIIDTSIENNNERKNPLKQQTSFDFFGIKKEYMLNEKVFSSEINEKSNSEIKTKTELGKISSIENLEKSDVSKQANKKIYGFEAKLEKENNDLRF